MNFPTKSKNPMWTLKKLTKSSHNFNTLFSIKNYYLRLCQSFQNMYRYLSASTNALPTYTKRFLTPIKRSTKADIIFILPFPVYFNATTLCYQLPTQPFFVKLNWHIDIWQIKSRKTNAVQIIDRSRNMFVIKHTPMHKFEILVIFTSLCGWLINWFG